MPTSAGRSSYEVTADLISWGERCHAKALAAAKRGSDRTRRIDQRADMERRDAGSRRSLATPQGQASRPLQSVDDPIGAPQQFAVHRDARFGELFAAVHKKTINMNSNPAPAADRAQVDVVPAENIVRPASIEVVAFPDTLPTMMSLFVSLLLTCEFGSFSRRPADRSARVAAPTPRVERSRPHRYVSRGRTASSGCCSRRRDGMASRAGPRRA